MTLFRASVPGRPVPQGRLRHTKTGRGYYAAASKAHRKLLRDAFWLAWRQTGKIAAPCRVTIEIAGAGGGPDLDNHAKMVLDALVDAGVLAKDSIMVVRELVVRVVDGEARTVVVVEAL